MYLGQGGVSYILGDLTGQGWAILGNLIEVLKTYVVDAHICTCLISRKLAWVSRLLFKFIIFMSIHISIICYMVFIVAIATFSKKQNVVNQTKHCSHHGLLYVSQK